MTEVGVHLDKDALEELQRLMGDEFSLLIDTFESDSTMRIDAIADAVVSGQADEIRRAAHSFKGSAGNMGAVLLTEQCRRLEELAHSGSVEEANTLLQAITVEYAEVKAALQAFRSQASR